MNLRVRRPVPNRPAAMLFAVLALGVPPGMCGEPAAAFLEALRAKGYHDTTLDYLERMAASPLVPDDFKRAIAYERGLTLIEMSQTEPDAAVRERQWDEAEQLLRQFIEQNLDHPLATAAMKRLAALITYRARLLLETSHTGDAQPARREARERYLEADRVLRQLRDALRQQLENTSSGKPDGRERQQVAAAERLTQLRGEYVQTLLDLAGTSERMSETVPPGSDEYRAILSDADRQYAEIFRKYGLDHDLVAGWYARMYQGRVNQKLGNTPAALDHYLQVLARNPYRPLTAQALRWAMECWLDPSRRNYAEAIRQGAEWLAQLPATEDRSVDTLALKLLLAKAYQAQAEETRDSPARRQALQEARKLAQFVARHPSPYQQEAQDLLARWNGAAPPRERPLPRTFREASDAGHEAIDAWKAAHLLVGRLPARLEQEKDLQVKAELQKQLEEAQHTLRASEKEAVDYFLLALRAADEKTPVEELNAVRCSLASLYHNRAMYYEAAVLAEFVARRYPSSPLAVPCAKIALASYLELYGENAAGDRQFETEHVIAIGQYLADRWPDRPEAGEALRTMLALAINAGDMARAKTLLAQIPENAAPRGEWELKVGLALWGKYLRELREGKKAAGEGPARQSDAAARNAELHQPLSEAVELFNAGVARLQGRPADAVAAAAMLALAQAYLETGQADRAIGVLEHPQYGPLTLLAKDDASTEQAGFAEDTYRTALRAYIQLLPTSPHGPSMAEKAQATLKAMRAQLGKTAGGEQRAAEVLAGLARDLDAQLGQATPENRRALAKGFEPLLRQLAQDASELSVLNWVAETFFRLGEGFASSGGGADAEVYYRAAAATFQRILETISLDAARKDPIRLRMAIALRRSRQYPEALATLETLLREEPRRVNVQVEAARTCAEWASAPGKAPLYGRAILGDPPDPQTKQSLVWGWARIGNYTASDPRFRDTFHEARYHVALCRCLWAESREGREREKLLEAARRDIELTYRLFGLGDEQRSAQYDALLKRIQAGQGERPLGLRALSAPGTARPPSKPGR